MAGLTKLRMKNESSRKKATNMRKVPMTKQISEKRRIPAPTPDTVELNKWHHEYELIGPNLRELF